MLKINRDKLEEGLMLTGRNATSFEGKAIRLGVHSFNNHNAMVVRASRLAINELEECGELLPGHGIEPGDFCIAEAKPPMSTLTSIEDYEDIINKEKYLVRFYRLKTLDEDQRIKASEYFVDYLLRKPYPKKRRMILLAFPIYNILIDNKILPLPPIRLTWCSQLDKDAFTSQDPHCLDGIDGKQKELFTPKTFDNRVLFGIFEDLTDTIIVK